jgi:hypothetical protein
VNLSPKKEEDTPGTHRSPQNYKNATAKSEETADDDLKGR